MSGDYICYFTLTRQNDQRYKMSLMVRTGNTKGGIITVPLTSCLTGFESAGRQLTIFVFICNPLEYSLVQCLKLIFK
jgi:hypothetical protein